MGFVDFYLDGTSPRSFNQYAISWHGGRTQTIAGKFGNLPVETKDEARLKGHSRGTRGFNSNTGSAHSRRCDWWKPIVIRDVRARHDPAISQV